MALTDEAICNMALGYLGGNLVTDLDTDDSVEADLCNANLEYCKDFVLESRDWTFARERDSITIDGTAPSFGWGSRFAVPADCITLRRVSDQPELYGGLPWEKEGAWIYTNTDALYVAYTARITDVTLFSPGFIRALVYYLAGSLANALTDNLKLETLMFEKFNIVLEQAGGRDGVQSVRRIARATTITGRRSLADRYDESYLV